VDAGDQFVLHLDQRIRGLGERRLQCADQDGVALGGLEAAQVPRVVGIAPARE
jgi:hypothetical protein